MSRPIGFPFCSVGLFENNGLLGSTSYECSWPEPYPRQCVFSLTPDNISATVIHIFEIQRVREVLPLDKIVLQQPVTGRRRLSDIDSSLVGLIFKGALNWSNKVVLESSKEPRNIGQVNIFPTEEVLIVCEPHQGPSRGPSLDQL